MEHPYALDVDTTFKEKDIKTQIVEYSQYKICKDYNGVRRSLRARKAKLEQENIKQAESMEKWLEFYCKTQDRVKDDKKMSHAKKTSIMNTTNANVMNMLNHIPCVNKKSGEKLNLYEVFLKTNNIDIVLDIYEDYLKQGAKRELAICPYVK